MEELNVKTKSLSAAASIQAAKDFAASPAATLAQAFSQFLSKGAARVNHALPFAISRPAVAQAPLRETYAPPPVERPAPARDDRPAPAPSPARAADRSAPDQGPRAEAAEDRADNSAPQTSAPRAEQAAAAAPATGNSSDGPTNIEDSNMNGGTAKIAVTSLHTKGLIEKHAEGDDARRRKAERVAKSHDDDRAPMDVAIAVLTGLTQTVGPDDDRADDGPADDPARDAQRADGIANALARLARNQARSGQAQDGETGKRVSGNGADARAEDGNAAKSSAATTADTRSRQAADLAQRVAPGERIAVEVNVADDAKTLVSRPAATLAAATALDAGGKTGQAQAGNGQAATTSAKDAGLAPTAAPVAVAAVAQTGAPQTSALAKGLGMAEAGAVTATQSATNTPGQAQAGAQGLATANNAQAATGAGATNAAQTAQRPAASFRAEILEQVSINIQKAIKDGADKITIQLRPADLGRVDVRIEIAGDGRAQVHVSADRADTLELLQRDARDLARALQDAGLQADAGSLQFGLREQAAEQRQARAKSGAGVREPGIDAAEAAEILPAWTSTGRPGRVDIRA